MDKILIIGADGQVGKHLLRHYSGRTDIRALGTCHTAPGPGMIPLDITKADETADFIVREKPTAVFLCSALTNVERCETHPHEAETINVAAARNIRDAADKAGARLAFFSSEYVFDGKSGPYDETAPVNPLSVYGRTKLEGERIVSETKAGHIIIRTTVVYSWDPGTFNFAMQMVNRLGKGEGMSVPADQYSNPTYAPDLAEAAAKLVAQGKTGIFNIVGRDRLNRYEFALLGCDVFGFDKKLVTPKITAELGQKAARPLYAGLLTGKLERETGHRPVGAREGLQEVKRLMTLAA